MRLSKREAALLLILLVAALIFLEYNFVYKPAQAKHDLLSEQYKITEGQVNQINRLIGSEPESRARKEKTLADIDTIATPFYDRLNPDALLYNTYSLFSRSGLTMDSIDTSERNVALVQLQGNEIVELAYQLRALADEYANAAVTTEPATEAAPADAEQPASGETEDNTSAVENYTIGINLSGSYDQIKQFISSLEALGKTITIPQLAIDSTDDPATVISQITINYYGIQKLAAKADASNTWDQPAYPTGSGNPYANPIILAIEPEPETDGETPAEP